MLFQSTHPVWGETYASKSRASLAEFQSTHPVWGETIAINVLDPATHKFQSTHPVWGETLACLPSLVSSTISIHSPRVG